MDECLYIIPLLTNLLEFFIRFVQVQTPAAFDFWCYILITWHPQTGLQFYGNSNLKASLSAAQPNPAPTPVYSGKPNFAVGRGLNQDPNQMCGLVYMSSIAVFKQHLSQEWVNKVFGFFWKNSKWIYFPTRYNSVPVLVGAFFIYSKRGRALINSVQSVRAS